MNILENIDWQMRYIETHILHIEPLQPNLNWLLYITIIMALTLFIDISIRNIEKEIKSKRKD